MNNDEFMKKALGMPSSTEKAFRAFGLGLGMLVSFLAECLFVYLDFLLFMTSNLIWQVVAVTLFINFVAFKFTIKR